MTGDEWTNLAQTIARVWPSGKMDEDTAAVWFPMLDDLEGGHVAAALIELGRTSKFQPTVSELRAETARQEVNARPQIRSGDDGDEPGNPFMTLRQWRDAGMPGLSEWSVIVADAVRITGGDPSAAIGREMP